ncbi:uncharacterized protein LOC136030457 isoform X2 [Artemia franciscana]|uniref:uncharacterized protein LOC136030457 isoform X2 n=1 Tax=Artemia franciscana TaxID=6661 RepID=UPI0032DAED60
MEDEWRSDQYRQSIVAKIDESIRLLRNSGIQWKWKAVEMEKIFHQNAKTKENYNRLVAYFCDYGVFISDVDETEFQIVGELSAESLKDLPYDDDCFEHWSETFEQQVCNATLLIEGSSSEGSSENKDLEIPNHPTAELKEHEYIALNEAGELILNPECAEKAKEMLKPEEGVNNKCTHCYSANPASIDDGTNTERRVAAQVSQINYDEMMVAQFKASMSAESVVAPPHLQKSISGRSRLNSLRDDFNMTQSSPRTPKKVRGKGKTKPKKLSKKKLQALLADMERESELDIAISVLPSLSQGPRPAEPSGQKFPYQLNEEYGRKQEFDGPSLFSSPSSLAPQISGSMRQKLPHVLQAVNMDHGRKERLQNALSLSTFSSPEQPIGQKLPPIHHPNATAPSGTNQSQTLYHKQGLGHRVSAPVTNRSTGIVNNQESFFRPVSKLIHVTRCISEDMSVQHNIVNDSLIQNVPTDNIASKTIIKPNTSLHNDLTISPIESTSIHRPATLQHTSGKFQHGSIGSQNRGSVVTSTFLNGVAALTSQNVVSTFESPWISVDNPALRVKNEAEAQNEINTFVFFDLETTGLKNPVRITEICLVAVTRDSLLKTMKNFERLKNMSVASNNLLQEVHPRVISKISLCTKPMKDIEKSASVITGLSNLDLANLSQFDGSTIATINHFLGQFVKPLCLVAHNGSPGRWYTML